MVARPYAVRIFGQRIRLAYKSCSMDADGSSCAFSF